MPPAAHSKQLKSPSLLSAIMLCLGVFPSAPLSSFSARLSLCKADNPRSYLWNSGHPHRGSPLPTGSCIISKPLSPLIVSWDLSLFFDTLYRCLPFSLYIPSSLFFYFSFLTFLSLPFFFLCTVIEMEVKCICFST